MQTEDLANVDGANSTTTATTAAPETDKVETPAKDDQSTATTEEGKQPDPATTQDPDAKAASEAGKALNRHKQTASERVQQAVARQREAERRAERAEARARELEGKIKPPAADEFTNPATRTAEEVNHALDQRRLQDLRQESAEAADEARRERVAAARERVEEHRASLENPETFDQAVHKLNPILTEETAEMLAELEDGPRVIENLAGNLAEARRIDKMSTREKAFALGRIAERLNSKPIPKVTTAPKPIDSVTGRSSGRSGFDPAKASLEEYSEQYRKNFKKG